MKVLTAEIAHETNTFSCHKTDLQAFHDRFLLFGADAIAARGKANTELCGFLDAGQNHDWEIDHVLSAAAGPSGKVTSEAFEYLCGPVVQAAGKTQYNGILLALHGAMVTDFCEDGEGELLQRLRHIIGSDLPIAVTLDLHANVSEQMCSLADIMVSYKTYPHVDMRETGRQAGEILHRAMTGEINPYTIRVNRPMLEEVNGGRTDVGPMTDRISSALAYEGKDDVFAVSINAGFASADINEIGPTVLVTGQGDASVHRQFAEMMADDIWARRNVVSNDYLPVEKAAAIAATYDAADGPLIIADYADNPGAGAYGDSTDLLRALLEAGVTDTCFGPMVDSEVVQLLTTASVGDYTQISLGGKTDPDFGGGPLSVSAKLLLVSDGQYIGDGPMVGGLHGTFGPCAVIRVDGIDILVVTIASQMLDLQQFRTFGIEPQNKRIIALKSMQHFRAAFEPISGQVIVCDSGALCTPDYARLNYQNVPRPIYPLDG